LFPRQCWSLVSLDCWVAAVLVTRPASTS
jgi:hypothetical protein